MTALDPYPTDLASLDEPIAVNPDAVTNRLIATLNRVAQALEQHTLAILDNGSQPVQNAPHAPQLAALPPVGGIAAPNAQIVAVCPIHNAPWKTVPAGVSKRNGQPYSAFQACSVAGCDQRPPR